MPSEPPHCRLLATSFLEWAFLRWVLAPASDPAILPMITPQRRVEYDEHSYYLDYEIQGSDKTVAIELDGYEFHSSRDAFSYDRLRQNDLQASGRLVIRFSYDSIRTQTARCVEQLQAVMRLDPQLAPLVIENPLIEAPQMDPDPLRSLDAIPPAAEPLGYFERARRRLVQATLRDCQVECFAALANYYRAGGRRAATVMSVGAGKTALGVAATLGFAGQRAMIITPGSVIRGTFDRAFDPEAIGNVLYGLPGGPLIPGCAAPKVLTLDREEGTIGSVSRDQLLAADVLITNFHSLGDGTSPSDLLAKLRPDDIDFIVVDEAHIAAADSYQRAFAHFARARTLLMSACFQRLDGKPIDADVVYRYRLIDSIADGHAKNLRLHRFAPRPEETTYEILWPDGKREEIQGREEVVRLLGAARRLARVTAVSSEPIRQVMRVVRSCLDLQARTLHPVKPRVLFSALGERHAEQLCRLANEAGINSDWVHHARGDTQNRDTRERFERDSGGLEGLVQIKMFGQGYDFPPISVVVPMRPYGSFSECYQFLGRGIRVIRDAALDGRLDPAEQFLDVVYHAELGLDAHIATIYAENEMDPVSLDELPDAGELLPADSQATVPPIGGRGGDEGVGSDHAGHPEFFVLFERGAVEERVVHDAGRIEQARAERARHALAQRYAAYAQSTENPVSFEQFAQVISRLAK